jgi:chitinase
MSNQNIDTRRRKVLQIAGMMTATPLVSRVVEASSTERDSRSRIDRRIIGYYPSWASEYTPQHVPYDKITHLNYAFIEPKSNGTVQLGVTGDSDPELLGKIREMSQKHQETSFMFSISSGWYSGRFSDAALTAERRERFARTAIEIMRTYDFDGIDIDWEYPDGTIRESDPHHLTLLLQEIRRQLDEMGRKDGRRYELSMAAAPIPSNIDPLEVDRIRNYLDHINVMNYDFHGGWSAVSSFNAPMYTAPDAPNPNPLLTADHAMRYWADQPISREKLVFGTPFYGRMFENVRNENHGLFQPFDGAGSATYSEIQTNIKRKPHYQYHWHPQARVPWLYSEKDDVFISYDDRHSIMEKTKYVDDNGFGGMMCWELSQDHTNTLVKAIHTVLAHPDGIDD